MTVDFILPVLDVRFMCAPFIKWLNCVEHVNSFVTRTFFHFSFFLVFFSIVDLPAAIMAHSAAAYLRRNPQGCVTLDFAYRDGSILRVQVRAWDTMLP